MTADLASSLLGAEEALITLIYTLPDGPERERALEAFRRMSADSKKYIEHMKQWNSEGITGAG